MHSVRFIAYGHPNIVGIHRTTFEITREAVLTKRGTCIIGVRATLSLADMSEDIKRLARSPDTIIVMRLKIGDIVDTIVGRGSEGLTYSSLTSMVARTSRFECGRTLMIEADKAASDINRQIIATLKNERTTLECSIDYITE